MELTSLVPPRTRRYQRGMIVVSVGLAVFLVAGLMVRRSSAGQSLELGTNPSAGLAGPAVAALSADDWRTLVAAQPDQALTAGWFEHRIYRTEATTDAVITSPDGSTVQGKRPVITDTELWAASDRPGRRSSAVRSPGEPPRPGAPSEDQTPAERAFAGVSYASLRSLPADPLAIVDRLRADTARIEAWSRGSAVQLVLLGLSQRVVPPPARAALVSVLIDRGLVSQGPARDRDGRPGPGFIVTDEAGAWIVVVDRAGGVLGWEHRPPGGQAPEYWVNVSSEFVTGVPR